MAMARERATRGGAEVLQFPHSGKMSGFRSSGISAYNNVDPHTVIRELVQNALDASMQAGREVVRVVFEIEHVSRSAIPARSEYQQHLDSAVATQREIGNVTQAQSIIEAMRASIGASAVTVLWVLDNGVGLDDEGMEKLLGDGHSGKADESTAGSYGNGHMTSFPASDLRYVVYGGVHEGGRTVSGHAILASHKLGATVHGEDGYLAKEIRANDLFGRFEFFDGSQFGVIRNQLDWIEDEFGTGSSVGILGFNNFNQCRDDDEVFLVIETVVATHFTPLIRDGLMEVQLWVDGTAKRTVDARALEEILARRRERERRDRNSIGPSGRQAWDTLETLNPEHQHTIETKAGKVRFHCRTLPEVLPAERTYSFSGTVCGLRMTFPGTRRPTSAKYCLSVVSSYWTHTRRGTRALWLELSKGRDTSTLISIYRSADRQHAGHLMNSFGSCMKEYSISSPSSRRRSTIPVSSRLRFPATASEATRAHELGASGPRSLFAGGSHG